ncbi:uncharacterized protein LOC132281731 [Cornus florida]|uniref:uncharacterized protein LOC132281731 n=1 Tax=Cornus florida TaxID=4283 RepID=UPI00289DEEF2|nr:uncharacterized protein LOC132281731 [Cornus florida]
MSDYLPATGESDDGHSDKPAGENSYANQQGFLLHGLGVFQDSLFVLHNDPLVGNISIRVMKQYGVLESWTNLFTSDFGRGAYVRFIGLKGNGDVLLTKNERLISVDIKTRKVKYLGVHGHAFCVNTCTESVVLIDKVNGGVGEQACIVAIDIYSLKEGCWRNLSVSGPVLPLCCDSSQVSLNGTIHWLSGGGNFPGPFIVTFNLGTQVFSLMELPRSLVYKKAPRRLSIAVFQDSLFVFENDYYGKVSIWMMKQYGAVESWTNLFSLDFDRESSVKVIGWKRNGEVLLTKDEEMVSVDIKTQEFKNVGMRGYDEPFCVNVYTESLVLIDKVHGGFGKQARSSLLQAPRTEFEEPRKL